tara:strand:+ start:1207 stop:2244 length:1038 start_codon:yes stop_codon:yes gene_type:complete
MAYSNVSKPALYIPIFDYLQSIGNIEYADGDLNDIHLLNPTKTHRMELDTALDTVQDVELNSQIEYDDIADTDGNIYLFILGHNLCSAESAISIQLIKDDDSTADATYTSVVNYNGNTSAPTYNGFSIVELNYTGVTKIKGFKILFQNLGASSSSVKIGCVSLCSKYTFPHSPDLALKMTREYDGVKTIETKGGATLSNAQYTRGGTHWASNYAWELSVADNDISNPLELADRSRQRTLGRRNWSLKFSYMNDSDIMPETESLDYYATEYTDNAGITLHKSNSFFGKVLNRVQGSHLPFIFLPNISDPNYNPDQWAIARLDQNEITINQVAHTVYDLSLKIREVW